MSQDRVFCIVGDSNVRRFANQVNQRACPDLARTQILSCGKVSLLSEAITEVNDDVDACIITCISNFICDAPPGSSSVSVRIDSVIEDFRRLLHVACSENASRHYLVFPPMYRQAPLWYRDGLGEIMSKFSSMMSSKRPANLLLLPSFSRPEYDPDGVHLTPFSGLEFIYHLFDSAKTALASLNLDSSVRQSESSEAIRALEDRMMASEQDHKRLNSCFEAKVAVDAELADFQENVRNEVFFVVSGLPRIPQELRGREWQSRAVADVQKLIRVLLSKELPIVVVQNVTGRHADAPTRYHVRMEFAAHSQEIRSKFGSFFIGGTDRRPPDLSQISISNRITPGTQVRIAVLRLLAKRYETSNPGAKTKVIGFESRPIIRLTPPPDSSDKRVRTFTYMEAIKNLPTCFSKAEIKPILDKIDPQFKGRLQSTFVVLSDDDVAGRQRGRRDGRSARGPEAEGSDAAARKRGRESSPSEAPDPKR